MPSAAPARRRRAVRPPAAGSPAQPAQGPRPGRLVPLRWDVYGPRSLSSFTTAPRPAFWSFRSGVPGEQADRFTQGHRLHLAQRDGVLGIDGGVARLGALHEVDPAQFHRLHLPAAVAIAVIVDLG